MPACLSPLTSGREWLRRLIQYAVSLHDNVECHPSSSFFFVIIVVTNNKRIPILPSETVAAKTRAACRSELSRPDVTKAARLQLNLVFWNGGTSNPPMPRRVDPWVTTFPALPCRKCIPPHFEHDVAYWDVPSFGWICNGVNAYPTVCYPAARTNCVIYYLWSTRSGRYGESCSALECWQGWV